MEKFEIVEEIGKGCALSIAVSAAAMTIAVATLQFNPSREIQDSCHRVLATASVIAATAGLGAWWSERTFNEMAARATERIEEARWESLKKVTKGKNYSINSCRGCNHLVGHLGSDKVLICAMHPYGWKGWDCPDKEEK